MARGPFFLPYGSSLSQRLLNRLGSRWARSGCREQDTLNEGNTFKKWRDFSGPKVADRNLRQRPVGWAGDFGSGFLIDLVLPKVTQDFLVLELCRNRTAILVPTNLQGEKAAFWAVIVSKGSVTEIYQTVN